LELIPPVPLPRRLNRALLATPGRLAESVSAAGDVLDRVGAEVVVGFGGYVAMPAYLAAKRRGVPIIVHEANARAGVANRIAAHMTAHVFTASPVTRLAHAVAIGMPLRPAIVSLDRAALREEARREFGLAPDGPVLLVTGGSQGARAINWAVSSAAALLRSVGVQVLHIAGPRNPVDVPEAATTPRYVVLPNVDRMDYAYAAADFAICRAGAMTCAELAAVGLPAAYVPLPLRGGEQRYNAEPVVAAGGGLLVDNDDLTPAWIEAEVVPLITDPAAVQTMSAAAARTGARDAAEVLAEHTRNVVAEHRRVDRPRGHPGSTRA
ncbi:MAG: UDP-N-acetylglucosamine--N-acetylmuramyl-(pentapeptide) pyrophosphoryl-undecaprenol, partial [Pseudonocardiales bacterium]|nr:UDP-N-acetylglucosamine--N-acetylmuramyl-(pentapeptide) pyrophosphoryl-undecaprenol [Pseudonocardiales bacterium]